MAKVLPFQAVLPPSELAADISSLPYDVMNRKEAAEMAAGKPLNFLHVTRAEIDLDDSVGLYDEKVYETGRKNWIALRDKFLLKDTMPCYYVYSQVMNGRTQTGIVATPMVEEYKSGIIKKHELTRKEKEDDRTHHIATLSAQTGPVFLTYRGSEEIQRITAAAMKGEPIFQFTTADGISHTGWRVPDQYTEKLQQAFEKVPALYIADGHHRAASAARTWDTLKGGEADRFLAVIFPASELKILPYNRVLLSLNGMSEDTFLQALKTRCIVTENATATPLESGKCSLYLRGKWYGVTLPSPEVPTAVNVLDVSRLQEFVLAPLAGITDPRTSKEIEFIGGIRGTSELEMLVNSGHAKAAFSMYPTTLDQLMSIADAGDIMPPKSTWFEPKLRDGLFVHEI